MTFISSTQGKFYIFAVTDTASSAIVAVRLSRREAREFVQSQPEERREQLRVRRGRVILYER